MGLLALIMLQFSHPFWVWLAVGCIICVVVFVVWPIFEAYYETVHAPRVDMYVCHKHGPVPKHLCVVFEEKEDPSPLTEQQYQCPFCFEDAFKLADAKLKETERVRAQ